MSYFPLLNAGLFRRINRWGRISSNKSTG